MLQQTQVKTVIPYWQRWMKRLPTVASLARARPERILKLWEGLGYYSRARNLQKAARSIVQSGSGEFPRDFKAVLGLPGVGPYTAGAICSIAFNQPTPVLDGNVTRVLTRLFGVFGDPKKGEIRQRLWQLAGQLVLKAAHLESVQARRIPRDRQRACSHLNQALMELGALRCLPHCPQCQACPLRRMCVAFGDRQIDSLPGKTPRPTVRKRYGFALVLEHNGRFLVRQRPPQGINSCLWEFPNREVPLRDRRAAEQFLAEFGLGLEGPAHLTTVRHAITRFRFTLEARYQKLTTRPRGMIKNGKWLELTALKQLPFASAHRKILDCMLRKQARNPRQRTTQPAHPPPRRKR